jgi:hypothetical protein
MVAAPFAVRAYLDEDGRTAQVASVSAAGAPLLGSLWFAYVEGRFWFSSLRGSPLLVAAGSGRPVAVIVDDFNPPTSIRQVRIRGQGQVEAHDAGVVRRIYRRYLGQDIDQWPDFFRTRVTDSARWVLWSVWPDSGLVVTSPGYAEHELRWSRRDECPIG